MATVEYLHLCDYAFSDQGNKPCIIGIFDQINAVNYPAVHPMMAVAMRLRGAAHETVDLKIELVRPAGGVLATMQGNVVIDGAGSAFMQVNMASLAFPEPGTYTLKVSAGGKALTAHSLKLSKMQPPQLGAQRPPEKMH